MTTTEHAATLDDVQVSTSRLAFGMGGFALVGACLGLRTDLTASLILAAALPAIWIGVALLTTPALYIGAAFMGVNPDPRRTMAALKRGLADAGIVLAGLTPALLFLTATTTNRVLSMLIGLAVLAMGAMLAQGIVYPRLFPRQAGEPAYIRFRTRGLWLAWSLVGLGIGAYLVFRSFSLAFPGLPR